MGVSSSYLLLSRHIGGNGEERGVLGVPTDEAGTDPHLEQMVKPKLKSRPTSLAES